MPTKDSEKQFYIKVGDKIEPLKEIMDFEPSVDEEIELHFSLKSMETSFSAEVKTHGSVINKVLVMIGAKSFVPNNWLKHHGYPMNRRK